MNDSGLLGTLAGGGKAGIKVTLRGLDNKVRRELIAWNDGTGWHWEWQRDTVYRGGQLLAAISSNPSAVVRHYSLDHLGTPRLLTDALGQVASKHTYFPYGEEATNPFGDNGKQDAEIHRFTGHERDLVDGAGVMDDLDYMHARYYSGGVGRFLSVDPVRGDEYRPQSWNLYSYVSSSPVVSTDPTGLIINETPELADNADYQEWKANLLSTTSGQEMWDTIASSTTFTLNIEADTQGILDDNEGAKVHSYEPDDDGNIVSAVPTVGDRAGDRPGSPSSYPVGTQVKGALLGLYTLAHELAHPYNNLFTESGRVNFAGRREADRNVKAAVQKGGPHTKEAKGWQLKYDALKQFAERAADWRSLDVLREFEPNWRR